MQKDHDWLKDFRSKEKQMETKIADDKNFLDKLVQKNERVQKEVERFVHYAVGERVRKCLVSCCYLS